MALFLMILGGAVGGYIGWLLDRKAKRARTASGVPAEDTCRTSTWGAVNAGSWSGTVIGIILGAVAGGVIAGYI